MCIMSGVLDNNIVEMETRSDRLILDWRGHIVLLPPAPSLHLSEVNNPWQVNEDSGLSGTSYESS